MVKTRLLQELIIKQYSIAGYPKPDNIMSDQSPIYPDLRGKIVLLTGIGQVGAPDNETALEWAKKFTLEGVAQNIQCAFLVLHGENDRVVPLDAARTLYERVGSKRKHLKIFTADEGGAEHCQVDHRQLGIDYIGDWLLANM